MECGLLSVFVWTSCSLTIVGGGGDQQVAGAETFVVKMGSGKRWQKQAGRNREWIVSLLSAEGVGGGSSH